MLLLDWLIEKYPTAKRTTLRRMVDGGRVLINGKPARRVKDPVAADDKVQVIDRPSPVIKPSAPPPFEILHEDSDVIVILKPPGLLTSTTKREKRATAAAKLEEYFAATAPLARVGVIHRLDRDASGLLVFSKNTTAYHHLKAQFLHHTVERVYTAVVEGIPQPAGGTIMSHLIELADGKVVLGVDRSKSHSAVTNYQTVQTIKTALPGSPKLQTLSLLRVTLETGRKHQIRAHFAGKNTPVLGDPVYGPLKRPPTRLLLAATTLAFEHPKTRERLRFEIKPPKEVTSLFPSPLTDVKPSASP
jgi:23S rRNA pseudouridine1911/1915/1917 synthase